jgi:hypothetical protein
MPYAARKSKSLATACLDAPRDPLTVFMSIPKQWALWDNIITDAMEMMLRKAYYVNVLKCTRN